MSSERERILLGYPPNSNIDFADVFGGPPRRSSSVTGLRRSGADSCDSGSSWRASGGSVSGLGDRPVFGEMVSPSGRRNRHLKDDFYGDIFMSGESVCSSPKRTDVSNPGSLVLSPKRSFENLDRGVEMLPEKLSLPSSSTASVPSVTTRASTTQDDQKIDSHVLYRQSPLSRQVSHSSDRLSDFSNSTSKNMSTSLENYVSKGQFHFSIYKWAGKGVTLVMPSKSNSQIDSRFKRLPEIIVQEVDVMIQEEDMSSFTNAHESLSEGLDKSMMNIKMDAKGDVDSINMERNIPNKFPTTKTGVSAQKPDLKNLQQLFNEDLNKQKSKEISRQDGEKEQFFRDDLSVPANLHNNQQAGKERTPVLSSEEKLIGSKVKGKVKDFIKIFNQEGSPKRKGTFENIGRRARGKDEGKGNTQVFSSESKADEQLKTTSSNMLSDEPVPIHQNIGMAEEVNFNISFDVDMIDDFVEMKDPFRPHSDSTPDIHGPSDYSVEESHIEDVEGHLVEPLFHDQNQDQKSDQDEIKSIDAKIQQWAKGKEGNIRSLLSTLQFVLWPESGWKPVPLVDIIEGSAVKRAYQKALLRLHPDKLQQKGAAEHQKYIAEKVFDIMQEAWDQFHLSSQI